MPVGPNMPVDPFLTNSECDESTPLKGEKSSKDTWRAWGYQVLVAGTGFFADAYDLFVIDMVLSILSKIHPDGLASHEKSLVASATVLGAIVGQVTFGLLGDWFGRRITFIVTCGLIIFGALASGVVFWTSGAFTLVYQLALCRFILGIGVGGEYPLSASIAAENASHEGRGRLIAAVFSMQGWGMLASTLFVLLFIGMGMSLEFTWRAVLIIGAIPSAMIVLVRARMGESELFEKAHNAEVESGAAMTFSSHCQQSWKYCKVYWRPLVGTTMTWLILDVTFYGTGSFKSRIGGFLMDHDATHARDQVWGEAMFAMICCCMAIPGYLLSVAFIDRIGRYNLQFWGFIIMSVNFFFICAFINVLSGNLRWLLVIFFGLTFLFSNFGPNTTTFVIPAEVYPTTVRATCHGLSAAAGKVGAVIGTVAFSPCEEAFGLRAVLGACGVICITGAVVTFFFTSDKVVDLAELDRDALKDVK